MKNLVHSVLAVALVMAIVSISLARGAPTKQTAFTHSTAVASVDVAPIVASVPPATVGYDVICNLATTNATKVTAVSTVTGRLSTTVDWRSHGQNYHTRSGPQPALVLLA